MLGAGSAKAMNVSRQIIPGYFIAGPGTATQCQYSQTDGIRSGITEAEVLATRSNIRKTITAAIATNAVSSKYRSKEAVCTVSSKFGTMSAAFVTLSVFVSCPYKNSQ